MKQISKKLSVLMLSISLIGIQNIANAGTLGKSRSYGMQRSSVKYNRNANVNNQNTVRNNNQANSTGYNNTQQQPTNQRNGVGVGGVLAGAAVGAAGGYLLGSAMSDGHNANNAQANNTANTQQPDQQTAVQNTTQDNSNAAVTNPQTNMVNTPNNTQQFPWGIIAILAIIFALGMMFFRKKAGNTINQTAGQGYQPSNNQNNFEIPNIKQNSATYTPGQYTNQQGYQVNSAEINSQQSQPVINTIERLPDGLEAIYFIRQAKGMFLHIQSMNNAENINEIAKYMTPELYNEIKESVVTNDYVADFSNLECNLVNATKEGNLYIASVIFTAMVSDDPNTPERKFEEMWSLVKPINNESAKWLVAGIQQI